MRQIHPPLNQRQTAKTVDWVVTHYTRSKDKTEPMFLQAWHHWCQRLWQVYAFASLNGCHRADLGRGLSLARQNDGHFDAGRCV